MPDKKKNNDLIRTILEMVMAPLLYFLIGQLVALGASFFYYAKYMADGSTAMEVYDSVVDAVYQKNVLLTMLAAIITLPIVYFWIYHRKKTPGTVNRGKFFWVIPFGISPSSTLNMLISISKISETYSGYSELAETIYQGNILFEIVGVAILPAMIEELIYRGVLYKGFRKYCRTFPAALLSALIFGAMHMNMVQFIYAGCLGILFALIYEKYQSLWAAVLMHMAANVMSILISEWTPLQQLLTTEAGAIGLYVFLLVSDIIVPVIIVKTVKPVKRDV